MPRQIFAAHAPSSPPHGCYPVAYDTPGIRLRAASLRSLAGNVQRAPLFGWAGTHTVQWLCMQGIIDRFQPILGCTQQPVGHGLPGQFQSLPLKLLLQPVQRGVHDKFLCCQIRHCLRRGKAAGQQRRLFRCLYNVGLASLLLTALAGVSSNLVLFASNCAFSCCKCSYSAREMVAISSVLLVCISLFSMQILYHRTRQKTSIFNGSQPLFSAQTVVNPVTGRWAFGCSICSPSMSQRYCCGVKVFTSDSERGH